MLHGDFNSWTDGFQMDRSPNGDFSLALTLGARGDPLVRAHKQ
jgi:hypothetical protein